MFQIAGLTPKMSRRVAATLAQWAERVPSEPALSVIVPTKDRLDILFPCLISVARTSAGKSVEIVLADTGSSDDTFDFYATVKLPIVRVPGPFNWGAACNAGARLARGRQLLFLDNDTQIVTEDWTERLMCVEREMAVGAVLTYPDGRIQSAGIGFRRSQSEDAEFVLEMGHIGRGRPHEDLEAVRSERALAVPGSFLWLPAATLRRLGGFDEAWGEDLQAVDLCLRARQEGVPVTVRRDVRVSHIEGASRLERPSREAWDSEMDRFYSRWGTSVTESIGRDGEAELGEVHGPSAAATERVLVVDEMVPRWPDTNPRTHFMLRTLRESGRSVTLFPLLERFSYGSQSETKARALEEGGVEVAREGNLDAFLASRTGRFDTVVLVRPHVFDAAIGPVKRHLPKARVVYDTESLFFVRERLKAEVLGLDRSEAERQFAVEKRAAQTADDVIAVTEQEKGMVIAALGKSPSRVHVWGMPVPVCPTEARFAERSGLLFVGATHPGFPNEDAVLHLVADILPRLRSRGAAKLTIVGHAHSPRVRQLASESVDIFDFEPDIGPRYEAARAVVVPHRFAAGLSWKLHEAMAHGVPSVVSDLVAGQIGLRDGEGALVARTPEAFADALWRLTTNEQLWNATRIAGLDYLGRRCDPDAMETRLLEIFRLVREEV